MTIAELQSSAADSIRILVATDSHVGYAEREPLRKDDSWKAFDEVMGLAKSQDVGTSHNTRGKELILGTRSIWSSLLEIYSMIINHHEGPCTK